VTYQQWREPAKGWRGLLVGSRKSGLTRNGINPRCERTAPRPHHRSGEASIWS